MVAGMGPIAVSTRLSNAKPPFQVMADIVRSPRDHDQCGEFEVPIIMAASSFRNFKFKTAPES
jgi:hypothetical protein